MAADTQQNIDTSASDAVLERLMALHPKKIDLSLDRMHRILDALGNPEKKLPPVIHIAGTNGKGSTTATLTAMAEAAGHRVHVYTSPHLVRFAERIRVAGKIIDETALTDLLERCEKAANGDPITFFEITTAAAFLAFSEIPADLCILEVGLGGRLDATNVVEKPAATCITPVSIDHEQFLGNTLSEITGEKAGIIKKDVPLVVGPQQRDAHTVIAKKAAENGVMPYYYNEGFLASKKQTGDGFLYEDWCSALDLPLPNLVGDHQIENAATAIAVAHAQKAVSIPDAAIKAGLGWVRWPARLQPLAGSNLHAYLPEGAELWLDGGHNPQAGIAVRDFLKSFDPIEYSITLILGMLNNKDAHGYLAPLTGIVNRVIAVDIPGEENAATAAELAAAATDRGISGIVGKDVEAALKMVTATAKKGHTPLVMIGGSLYLAGHVLRKTGLYPT